MGTKNKETHEGIYSFIGAEVRQREEKQKEQGIAVTKPNVDMKKKFGQYISKHYLRSERDMISFREFCELEWNNEYPALIYDFLYYLYGHRIKGKKSTHDYYSRLDRNFFNVTSNTSLFGGTTDVFMTQGESFLNV